MAKPVSCGLKTEYDINIGSCRLPVLSIAPSSWMPSCHVSPPPFGNLS
jgi:hypothetical protein